MNLVLAQSTCGPIGNDNTETQLTAERGRRFYLNTANPATCNGTVSNWTVCYYGPRSLDSDASYWATYAVYRRNDSGGQERFEQVSRIFSAVRTNNLEARIDPEDGGIQQDGFVCYNDSTGDPPVTVQAGDIIGACIFDPQDRDVNSNVASFDRFQLDIVGRISGESLLELSESEARCSMNSIPSDITVNGLSNRNDRRLHLYANIGKQYRLRQGALRS